MKAVQTLSTNYNPSLRGPIFSSTVLRPTADRKSRSYRVSGIVAILLLVGAIAMSALPLFAPSSVPSAPESHTASVEISALSVLEADSTSSQAISSIAHPPLASTDDDVLSLGSEDILLLMGSPDQEVPTTGITALPVEDTAAAEDGDDSEASSSQDGTGQPGEDASNTGVPPANTSDDGESEAGGASGGESAGGDPGGDIADDAPAESDPVTDGSGDSPSNEGAGDEPTASDGNDSGNDNSNGNGNGPPMDTPGTSASDDNPAKGDPQGNPGGDQGNNGANGSGNSSGNGNGNGNGKK